MCISKFSSVNVQMRMNVRICMTTPRPNSMQQFHSCEASCSTAHEQIQYLFWISKMHHHAHNNQPPQKLPSKYISGFRQLYHLSKVVLCENYGLRTLNHGPKKQVLSLSPLTFMLPS